MTAQVTITAKAGPAEQSTALVLTGVTSVVIDVVSQLLQIYQGADVSGPAKEFDLTGVTTLTDTISGSGNAAVHTIVVS